MNAKGMKSGVHYSHRGENRSARKVASEVGQVHRYVPARAEGYTLSGGGLNSVKYKGRINHPVKNKPNDPSVKG